MQLTDLWVRVTKEVFPGFKLPCETVAEAAALENHLEENQHLLEIYVSIRVIIDNLLEFQLVLSYNMEI
jgi:hypothetical protein